MKIKICAIALAIALSGCAATSAVLVNDKGNALRCAHFGMGWLGTPLALIAQQNCVTDARKLGFKEISQ